MGQTLHSVLYYNISGIDVSLRNFDVSLCRYKEGKVILEHALITESEGFQDTPSTPSRNNYE